LVFFVGKGGVGKTTISSAYALWAAASLPRAKLLLLSTDPAHSLGDVLQVKLSDKPKRLASSGKLWARQLDADKQIKRFLTSEREEILSLLNKGSLFSRHELEPLLDTTLPGMAEVAALLAIHELLASDYDEIVVDTAPMGHAIRLFQMPTHFARFLAVLETAARRDVVLAQHFGGYVQRDPALDRWSLLVEQVGSALSANGSKLVMVTTPEPFSLKQAVRSAPVFSGAESPNRISEVVLNRIIDGNTTCPHCHRRVAQSRSAQGFLRKHFSAVKVFAAQDPGGPILGLAALRSLGAHVFDGRKLPSSVVRKAPKTKPVELQPTEWPLLETPLTLTLGKGGVGKTTISAALAVHHRSTAGKQAVGLCSIDPAPSLADILGEPVTNEPHAVLGDSKLRVAELDATAEFRQWADELRVRIDQAMTGEQSGLHLDLSLDREFLLALLDVVPPGVDEIFAVFRILDLLQPDELAVIDMAPTGHALEVLRTPARLLAWARVLLKTLAAHRTLPFARDAGVELARLSQNVRDVAAMFSDRKRCRVAVVSLPEPLPDYETARLVKMLHDLKTPLGAVFLNRVMWPGTGHCGRCQRTGAWQAASIFSLRRKLRGADFYVVREFDSSVAGARALQRFTRELWRLV
jgi:arsenite-transporting ATPase